MLKKKLPSVKQAGPLAGKRVLLRASLNVPVQDGKVTNQFRITRALPTINYLRDQGAKVIIVAHLGREPEESLAPVQTVLHTLVGATWSSELIGPTTTQLVSEMADGDVLLLENVRSDTREKNNDPEFAKELADLADVYVNDAFAASHREHASLVGIPQYLPSYFGFNFLHEYTELIKVMEPEQPSLFILGGAKFETKLPLVDKYTNTYSHVFIGGALANDIFKAQGLETGQSLHSAIDLRTTGIMNHPNIITPVDVTVQGSAGVRVTTPDDVRPDEIILDAGPKSIEQLAALLRTSKTVLWNGPLGSYEHGFAAQTEALAKVVAQAPAYSLVGGGDTIAAIESLGIQEQFNFLSTAGGAMLTFLEHGSLPAIDVVLGND